MTILLYCVKLILVSGLLFGYYILFLRNRPFHRYNRLFLLLTTALAIVAPLVVISLSLPVSTEKGISLARTLQVISAGDWNESEGAGPGAAANASWRSLSGYAGLLSGLIYGIGVLAGSFFLLQSLRYIARIRKTYPFIRLSGGLSGGFSGNGVRLYDTIEPGTPFSFFRQIFWNREIPTDTPEGQQILRHELYHVRQGHSSDILFLELCCCLGWFNPFFHLIKRELRTIHEFLADEDAVPVDDRLEYAGLLVQHAIRQSSAGPAHPFSGHEIKRRIGMITRSRELSRKGGWCSRVLAGPLLLVLVSAFGFRQAAPAGRGAVGFGFGMRTGVGAGTEMQAGLGIGTGIKGLMGDQPFTVVIDAGHGGSDDGTIRGEIREKDITLSLAQKISGLAEQYHIHVVLTRDRDELPGGVSDKEEGLRKRTEIALASKADLFISIHVNNSGDDGTPPEGFEAYISDRRTDKEGASLADALLQQVSTLYSTSFTIKQRKNRGIYILDHSPCPAVILECGSLSWPKDRAFITDKDNQEKVARKILEGIVQYRDSRG